MGGCLQAEKDSDTSGRADSNMTLRLVGPAGAVDLVDGAVTLPVSPQDGAVDYMLYVEIAVSEPLLGVPCFELKSEEAAFIGVNAININLLFNDFSRVLYTNEATKAAMGANKITSVNDVNNDEFLRTKSYVVVNYLSLHASDYCMPK